MSRKRRNYSEEFKVEAIELTNRIGVSAASKELGVAQSALHRWKTASKSQLGSKNAIKSPSELEKENRRLQKENIYLKKINDVLKKSVGIFSEGEI